MTSPLVLISDPWNGCFQCAAHLLPPGVLHCMHSYQLWMPTGLLFTQPCESRRLLNVWKDAPKRVETRAVFMPPTLAQEREESNGLEHPWSFLHPYYCASCVHVFQVSMVLPNVYVATSTVIPEPANPPPTYSTEVQGSK